MSQKVDVKSMNIAWVPFVIGITCVQSIDQKPVGFVTSTHYKENQLRHSAFIDSFDALMTFAETKITHSISF